MKIKTSELSGSALDWIVAKCEGRVLKHNPIGKQSNHGWWIWEETPSGRGGILLDESVYMEIGPYTIRKTRIRSEKYSPSSNWSQGGPIIEREEIGTRRNAPCSKGHEWEACPSITAKGAGGKYGYGPTPLIAAMRCYVSSKCGDEVEIPKELLK